MVQFEALWKPPQGVPVGGSDDGPADVKAAVTHAPLRTRVRSGIYANARTIGYVEL